MSLCSLPMIGYSSWQRSLKDIPIWLSMSLLMNLIKKRSWKLLVTRLYEDLILYL